jgi:septum formation protein
LQALVLASGSRYRAELLRRLGLPFSQCSPDIDEAALPGERPLALAVRLAAAKAAATVTALGLATAEADANDALQGTLVIASDQVAALGHDRLRKPGTADRAQAQLASMSGQSVHFYTALCLVDCVSGRQFSAVDTTVARLRQLSDTEIARYVAADQPLDCAGSFKVEALGISLFESVDSRDPTSLTGLPLIALCAGLRQFGIAIP